MPTYPARSHFQRTLNRESGKRVRMNVSAHQEKDEKTDKRKAGEERRQETDFKEAECCSSAVIQGAAWRKMVCVGGSFRGNWDPREDQQSFRPNPNGVGDRTTTLRRLLIGAVQFCSLYILCIRQKSRISVFRKIRVNTWFGNGQKVHIDD